MEAKTQIVPLGDLLVTLPCFQTLNTKRILTLLANGRIPTMISSMLLPIKLTLHKWSNILLTSMWWMKVARVDLRKMLTLICSSKYVRKLALVLKVYEIMVQIVLIFLIWQRGNVWAKEAQIRNHAVCTIKWWLSNVLVNIPMDKLGLDVLASTVPVGF